MSRKRELGLGDRALQRLDFDGSVNSEERGIQAMQEREEKKKVPRSERNKRGKNGALEGGGSS